MVGQPRGEHFYKYLASKWQQTVINMFRKLYTIKKSLFMWIIFVFIQWKLWRKWCKELLSRCCRSWTVPLPGLVTSGKLVGIFQPPETQNLISQALNTFHCVPMSDFSSSPSREMPGAIVSSKKNNETFSQTLQRPRSGVYASTYCCIIQRY